MIKLISLLKSFRFAAIPLAAMGLTLVFMSDARPQSPVSSPSGSTAVVATVVAPPPNPRPRAPFSPRFVFFGPCQTSSECPSCEHCNNVHQCIQTYPGCGPPLSHPGNRCLNSNDCFPCDTCNNAHLCVMTQCDPGDPASQ
jgi:hypothetical protein